MTTKTPDTPNTLDTLTIIQEHLNQNNIPNIRYTCLPDTSPSPIYLYLTDTPNQFYAYIAASPITNTTFHLIATFITFTNNQQTQGHCCIKIYNLQDPETLNNLLQDITKTKQQYKPTPPNHYTN